MPDRSLLDDRHVRRAWMTVALAFAVLVALALWVHKSPAKPFDNWWSRELFVHVGSGASRVLVDMSQPVISVCVPVAVLVAAVVTRRGNLAALAVAVPLLGPLLTEEVGKPLVDRTLGDALAFPSGHETGISCAAFVLCVAAGQLLARRGARIAVWVVSFGWVLGAAAGLVRAGYHYATDTLGAMALTICVGLTLSLVIDQVASRTRRRSDDYALS